MTAVAKVVAKALLLVARAPADSRQRVLAKHHTEH